MPAHDLFHEDDQTVRLDPMPVRPVAPPPLGELSTEDDRALQDFISRQQRQYIAQAAAPIRTKDELLDEVVTIARIAVARGEKLRDIAAIYKIASDIIVDRPAEQHLHLHNVAGRLEHMTDEELQARMQQLDREIEEHHRTRNRAANAGALANEPSFEPAARVPAGVPIPSAGG